MKGHNCIVYYFLGGKDAKSSGFGYFMSAAIVLALCLVSYFMLHKLVCSPIVHPVLFFSQDCFVNIGVASEQVICSFPQEC